MDAAIEAHLAAIRRRDLDAFAATVHPDVTLVLPDGRLLAGRDAVVAFHRGWFGDPDWRMELTLERHCTVGDTAVALFAVDYRTPQRSKRYRLALVFVRHDGEWLLVHDQNTYC